MQPTLASEQLQIAKSLWSPASAAAGAAGMAVAAHLWKRFRSRMVTLRCEVSHTAVANVPGMIGNEVEVRYRGITAPNLFQCSIVLENDSTTDLKDVVLNLAYKDGTIFVSAGGTLEGSNQFLNFTPAFTNAYDRGLALTDEERNASPEWQYTSTHRDFIIPVLNRGVRARFLCTVHAASAASPELSPSCDHLGVHLIRQAPRQLVFGVPTNQAALVGFLAAAALLGSATTLLPASWRLAWVFFVAGSAAQMLGVLIVKSWRSIMRLLS